MVLKPSEMAPLSALALAQVCEEAGLPPGALNVVQGRGDAVGEALVNHSLVKVVSFTGSVGVGRQIGALAGGSIKRVALELGGKSPSVILDDADLERAVAETVAKCFQNAGQSCNAHSRMLVPRALLAECTELARAAAETYQLGDPMDEETTMGPLAAAAQRERVRAHIQRARADGASVVTGGEEPPARLPRGFYVRPTILGDVRNEMAIAREEVFGPVLSVIAYEGEAQAVAIANDSDYGLSGAVWSGDAERALAVAQRLRTGQVHVNGGKFNPLAPFGGFNQSGVGASSGASDSTSSSSGRRFICEGRGAAATHSRGAPLLISPLGRQRERGRIGSSRRPAFSMVAMNSSMCRRIARSALRGSPDAIARAIFPCALRVSSHFSAAKRLEFDVPLEHAVKRRKDQVVKGVAGGLGYEEMEVDKSRCRALAFLDRAHQFGGRGLVQRARRRRGRGRLDDQPELEQLTQRHVCQRDHRHEGVAECRGIGVAYGDPAPRSPLDLDEAIGVEQAQGLSDGRPAEPRAGYQLRLGGEPGARREGPANDVAPKASGEQLGRFWRRVL